jgi:hypothetical protein
MKENGINSTDGHADEEIISDEQIIPIGKDMDPTEQEDYEKLKSVVKGNIALKQTESDKMMFFDAKESQKEGHEKISELAEAASCGDVALVQQLLDNGADVLEIDGVCISAECLVLSCQLNTINSFPETLTYRSAWKESSNVCVCCRLRTCRKSLIRKHQNNEVSQYSHQ